MNSKIKPDHTPDEVLRFNSALAQMSETKLASLLDIVETLEADFQRVPLHNRDSVEGLIVAQKSLKSWNAAVDRVLVDKQAKDTREQLRSWENEGGKVKRVRVSIKP